MARRKSTPAAHAPAETPSIVERSLPSRTKSLVFISHDSRDGDLAEAFSNLLSDVSGGTLKSFRSSDKRGTSGIEFGAEWYKAIMGKLGDATDVVALLTKRSLDRPWILYEAGVAKGKLDTTVFGIAIGVPLERVSTGPFAQFQNCAGDEDSLTKLVIQLMERNPDAEPREEAIRRQVKAFRDAISGLLKEQKDGSSGVPEEPSETNIAKLFEEVKAMVLQLPDKVEERVKSVSRRGRLSRVRFHPMMLEEVLFHPSLRESPDGPATGWLMFISLFRDEAPWLYEPGLEVYRALRAGNSAGLAVAKEAFYKVVRASTRGPFFREMMRPDDEETYMMLRHLPEMAESFLSRLEPPPKPKLRGRRLPNGEGK